MIKRTVILVSTVATLMLMNNLGHAQDSYSATLKKMFEVSGSEAAYQGVVVQLMSTLKGQYSQVDAELWKGLEQEFLKASMDELVLLLEPIYKKHLSEQDLKGIIKFYQSPVGKKFAQSTPHITTESIQAGEQWGRQLATRLIQRMQEKGY